jgi:DNA replication protein DnaC
MPHDSAIHQTVRQICADRGITPADALDERPLTRRDFRRQQLADVIHRRWGGRYDEARPDPRVATWIDDHLRRPQEFSALFLNGATGSGKTHNAVAALRAIAEDAPLLRWQAVTHPDLGDEVRPRSDNSHEGALDRYLDAGLLLLDDLGAAMSTPWMTDCLQRLVDHRWTRRLATIYTTNLPADALRSAVGDRVFSRLGDATHVNLGSVDRRWQR